ncbi:MAG: TRAP transporter small permease subunit [Rhodobacteraceae bacterium]|nr:TRAP transporter small permease subunit [Paracoccaceae bacterium]
MLFLRKFTVILGALSLVAMILITCTDIVMRYIFNDPIFGSGEMIQLLLGVAIFAGMFVVTLDRGHVNVSLFEPFLLSHFRTAYRGIFDGFSLIGVVSVTGILLWKTWDLWEYPEESIVLQIPMILVVGTMAALSCLSVLGALFAILIDERQTRALPSKEQEN